MKYIRKFESEEEYKSLLESGKLIPPMMGMIKDGSGNNSLKLKSIPPKYLNFKALGDGCTISMSSATNPNIEYSTDYCETWTTWDYSEISLNKGDIVWMRGWNPKGFSNSSSKNKFVITTGKIGASGNILSLVWGKRFEKNNTIPSSYCFMNLFRDCTALENIEIELSATILTEGCYACLFQNCSSLTTAPNLLVEKTSTNSCRQMFMGCISLVNPPKLTSMNLAPECYYTMFKGCTSLTTPPQLPATTLANSCYSEMFYDCSSLNNIVMLALNISAYNCLYDWVSGVASTGTFTKYANMTSLPNGYSGIPSGWEVKDNLISFKIVDTEY